MADFTARCPLMTKEAYPNLSDKSRSCDVPAMQTVFLREHPDMSCSQDGRCIVHTLYPEDASIEIHLQNICAEETRKNRAIFKKSCGG